MARAERNDNFTPRAEMDAESRALLALLDGPAIVRDPRTVAAMAAQSAARKAARDAAIASVRTPAWVAAMADMDELVAPLA